MADGRVTAVGRPSSVLSRQAIAQPADPGEAGAVLRAVVQSHDDVFALTALQAAGGVLTVPRLRLSPGTAVRVRVRARDVMLAIDEPKGLSALNILRAQVEAIEETSGPSADVLLVAADDRLTARLTRRSIGALGLEPGRQVYAVIKSIAFDDASLSPAPHYRGTADAATDPKQ